VPDLTCREVTDSAPGFALDILDPRVRARVAAHLIRCPRCRETVSGMQESAARLLDVGGGAGPDWGEPDWPTEMDLPSARPARRRLRMMVTLAAAALLIVGTTFGPELEQAASHPENPVASAVLLAGNQPVGSVHVYAHPNPAVEIQLTGGPVGGRLDVVLLARDGTARKIGAIQVVKGRAAWLGPDPVAQTELTGLLLVDSSRHEVASASVP
jgi:hypothetical protein